MTDEQKEIQKLIGAGIPIGYHPKVKLIILECEKEANGMLSFSFKNYHLAKEFANETAEISYQGEVYTLYRYKSGLHEHWDEGNFLSSQLVDKCLEFNLMTIGELPIETRVKAIKEELPKILNELKRMLNEGSHLSLFGDYIEKVRLRKMLEEKEQEK